MSQAIACSLRATAASNPAVSSVVADIAIIDERLFEPLADFANPDRLSSGVVYLLINGELVINTAEHHGHRAGRVLAKTELECPSQP